MPSCRIWPLLGLLVGQQQVAVHGLVGLAVRVVDLRRREQRVHAERAGLVRDDRHEPVADLRVLHQVLEQPDERHRGGDRLLARAAASARRRPRRRGSASGLARTTRLGR